MLTRTKVFAASLFMGASMLFTPVSPVAAQTTVGDGLVNVAVGDITIEDAVDVGVAAQIAANICDVKVGPVVLLGRSVDATGRKETVCKTDQGPVRITQN